MTSVYVGKYEIESANLVNLFTERQKPLGVPYRRKYTEAAFGEKA